MPVSYQILEKPNVVVALYTGVVTLSDISTMFESYQADPDFSLPRPHIADLRDVDTSEVGFSEVFSLFAMYGRRYAEAGVPMRVALVVSNEVSFGMSRIFENLTEQSNWARAAIFETIQDAKTWVEQS
ncbi:hypothetical protein [Lentibacter sp. XHP0401]|uniref:hypothetical protein n=1 Tax=Lentibacter sp. XHP0401 TaxID=2984334 RepID=UPI0021E88FD9|nr:hypothetical protein [Lentibacter sp. XHP0401]MCV2891938.1 hypothetical protein [Lentibacter sp. XHP0401]